MNPRINLLKLQNYTIQQQLELEEALLRNTTENWCIVQGGVPASIVLGISSKPDQLINLEKLRSSPVPLIKRYTGGGTVVVDDNTVFVSFICQADQLHVPCCPEKIFHWSSSFYKKAFTDHSFSLRERDYVFGDRKFGGNAQYLMKGRWVHHSTLLWDYNASLMDLLLLPQRRPAYRSERSHEAFLCKLKDYFKTQDELWSKLYQALDNTFSVNECDVKEVEVLTQRPHRKVTASVVF